MLSHFLCTFTAYGTPKVLRFARKSNWEGGAVVTNSSQLERG